MDATSWKSLSPDFKPIFHVLKKDELMYTPMGWVIIERTSSGTMLYGVRISFMIAGPAATSEYGKCLELLTKQGANVERWNQVFECVKAAGAKLTQA